MSAIEENLTNWKEALLPQIQVGGLLGRDSVAHKWKVTYRVIMLRELAFWREQDLMAQSYALFQQGHGLGARILLRSGFETLATLIYLNMLMEQVMEAKVSFDDFCEKTSRLLLGSRDDDQMPQAVNIVTVLEKCDKRYPGLAKIYAKLSESAHPNYEGMMGGYSLTNYDEFETNFSNRWMELHGDRHEKEMTLCMETFHHEYDVVWLERFEALEKWIVANDAELEAARKDRPAEEA